VDPFTIRDSFAGPGGQIFWAINRLTGESYDQKI